jgi:hypothetical protein
MAFVVGREDTHVSPKVIRSIPHTAKPTEPASGPACSFDFNKIFADQRTKDLTGGACIRRHGQLKFDNMKGIDSISVRLSNYLEQVNGGAERTVP